MLRWGGNTKEKAYTAERDEKADLSKNTLRDAVFCQCLDRDPLQCELLVRRSMCYFIDDTVGALPEFLSHHVVIRLRLLNIFFCSRTNGPRLLLWKKDTCREWSSLTCVSCGHPPRIATSSRFAPRWTKAR